MSRFALKQRFLNHFLRIITNVVQPVIQFAEVQQSQSLSVDSRTFIMEATPLRLTLC